MFELLLTAVALVGPEIILGASILFTLLHSYEEVWGDDITIWEHLGLTRSWLLGFLGLAAFGGFQVYLATQGYLYDKQNALWALFAIRVGDVLWSHWRPWIFGADENPGIATAWLYVAEAAPLLYYLLTR